MTDLRIPDGITPLDGYRTFKVESGKGKVTVRSLVYQETVWQPHEIKKAECSRLSWTFSEQLMGAVSKHKKAPPVHDAPEETCECGIYSLKSVVHAISRTGLYLMPKKTIYVDSPDVLYQKGYYYVCAKVAVWGKVIVAEDGYRSEYAMITRMFTDPRQTTIRLALEEQYGVPVESMNMLIHTLWKDT